MRESQFFEGSLWIIPNQIPFCSVERQFINPTQDSEQKFKLFYLVEGVQSTKYLKFKTVKYIRMHLKIQLVIK